MTPYRWTIRDVLDATGGSLVSGTDGREFAGIGIDSRTIDPDRIFVAIAGESHDGHRFVADVLAKGGQGFVVAEDQTANLPLDQLRASGAACVTVADTTAALGDLARFNRNRKPLTVLAITGSNGKTSTRMLTEQVVSGKYATLGTQGNLNNHIGLPLTLLRRAPQHEAAVVELGMNHPGEITRLGEICQPDVGIITNVAPAHLEGLGSVDNIAAAKGELLATIRSGGTAILNADDVRVAALADACPCPVLFFGTGDRAGIRAENVRSYGTGLVFTLITTSGQVDVHLATPLKAMVANALAAAAAGEVLGVPLDRIKAGLEAFSPGAGRMAIRELEGGIRLLDDTYNANPGSMAAAIETLADMGTEGRTLAVLGDMLELGDQSHLLHRKIGRAVGEAGIDRLYAAGRFASEMAAGAREEKMTDDRIFVGTKAEIIEKLNDELRAGDLILVKGSRGMAMEEVADEIARWATERTR
ncbi:UDP-N-acetylmuramoyl-tripeptide--D-alanyl-D-alanine ligase [uncultured Desulfosarcina sp.]|uniref:UDP-N-acetylmuramoyl-tripeptide--D-alanyl-D- alanine ligase n=1 Tax=uncultured Desulfosarcina sp. TaxID=218289 RepID=UPI0029C7D0FC|nr:UDP-N-acetylmuramoyl-tripeptide--D-alanyl-D-alanine ligase [uncultured Desulfosarcina sp.]